MELACLFTASSSRANQGFAGSTPLFEDTSTEPPMNPGANAGVPPGMMQFPMADVMQSPVTNVALQYGSNMANQGKEYVEKNVRSFVAVVFNVESSSCFVDVWPVVLLKLKANAKNITLTPNYSMQSITLSLPRVMDFKFPLTSNITSHSMKNLAFHSLLR